MSLPYLHPYLGLSNGLNTLHAAGGGGAGGIGGWVELGRTTLGSSNTTINVTSLADKRYLMFLASTPGQSGSSDHKIQLNTDTGSNYAGRRSINGTTDNLYTSTNTVYVNSHVGGTVPSFGVGYFANYSTKEKLALMHFSTSATGAANDPNRTESVFKHAQTSNPISSLQYISNGSATFNTGSEVVVLGWDPADSHTNNFWEELVDAPWSSGDTIDTGTFAAKKYLWVQSYTLNTQTHWNKVYFNADSGANYAFRQCIDGGADGTATSTNEGLYPLVSQGSGGIYTQTFSNYFIINNASKEKLVIGHSKYFSSTETGSGSAPHRIECAGKWANTSNQITRIQYINANSNTFEGGRIKVWGAD